MHRFTNPKGIQLIKLLEGFKAEPYMCSGGYLTIGYGHRILPSDPYKIVTQEKADQILENDRSFAVGRKYDKLEKKYF